VLSTCSYDGAGAVWDICARGEDAAQLSSYLAEHAGDFSHQGSPVSAARLPVVGANAVFSQAFMMSQGHREALQRERGVELWHFEQHRGEAVFIPGGCPHQVRNLASCCKVRYWLLPCDVESLHQAIVLAVKLFVSPL
jgi:lysine-specific demethylase 3